MAGYGIGGRIFRPRPKRRPDRIVSTNVCAVHVPRPVSRSGVRFAVKLTPQGPAQAVMVAAATTSQGPSGRAGAGGITRAAGCPDRKRLSSGAGPLGPIFRGV